MSWIVNDPRHGLGEPGPATLSGTVSKEPLPTRARIELGRNGVALAKEVRVLEAFPPVENPLEIEVIVLLAVVGAIACGLLLAAAILAVKVRRMDAILR